MPKYIIKTDGTLLNVENNSTEQPENVSLSINKNIVGNKSKRSDNAEYIGLDVFPTDVFEDSTYKNISEEEIPAATLSGSFIDTGSSSHYMPFNTFADDGDDADGTFAFGNLDTKYQLPLSDRLIFQHLIEFLTITVSSIITIAIFEFLYNQYLEDVRSKTDLTKGSNRQKNTKYLISNLFELPLQEAGWPKTKTGALSSFVTGLSFDITNLNLLDDSLISNLKIKNK